MIKIASFKFVLYMNFFYLTKQDNTTKKDPILQEFHTNYKKYRNLHTLHPYEEK